MRDLVNAIIQALKDDKRTLREISASTGVNQTMLCRIRAKDHSSNIEALIKLADYYGISALPTTLYNQQLEDIKRQAYLEIYEKAELKVAQKYNMTPELLAWRLTAPNQKAV